MNSETSSENAPVGAQFVMYSPKRSKPLKDFAAELNTLPTSNRATACVLTDGQAKAISQLEELASAYFSGLGRDLPFRPRYNALAIAATGTGKTFLAKELARRMGAVHHVISLGEWIVLGAQHGPTTITTLLRVLEKSEKTVLLLDEVDKFCSATDSGWSRYCAAEIWSLLDRRIPFGQFRSTATPGSELFDLLKVRLEDGLYIIGAGTFQSVFENVGRRGCGFRDSSPVGESDIDIMNAIKKQEAVPPELLSRFSPRPIILRYPARAEIPKLLDELGLNRLADEVGLTIDPDLIDFEGVGMRALEQLGADLIIEKERQKKTKRPDLTL